ncbi:hypothetical protein HY745_06105 [Candidatus Desantisbacteria bacterium]|nr:hypothetical protein [Candidatus Desantisbacteria bacterium]
MNLKVKTGKIDKNSLQTWINEEVFLEWIKQYKDTYALIEYVHRFNFSDIGGMIADLNRNEIEEYGLKGRIFWDKGQIEWRRVDYDKFSILILIEDGEISNLPDKITSSEIEVKEKIRTLILWGSYKKNGKEEKAYFEQRVSGSIAIDYPAIIKNSGKRYPKLKIKEYLNDQDEPILWRFVSPMGKR